MVLALVAWVWQGSAALGILLGITLICNMVIAATVGTAVPLLLKRFNIDPAVASAPFISTSIDVLGLVIYSVLASLFIPMMTGI